MGTNLDANGDGQVSKEELSTSYKSLLECSHFATKKTFKDLICEAGLNPDYDLFDNLDTNHDGTITWEEFETTLQNRQTPANLSVDAGGAEETEAELAKTSKATCR